MERIENIDFCIRYLATQNGVQADSREAQTLGDKQRLLRALMNIWQPQALSEEFLQAQDAELQLQKAARQPLVPATEVWQGDITRLEVDAIVNAANAQMLGCFQPLHACIDNAIHSAAGLQLRKECHDIMQGGLLRTGDAVITAGYNLPARHVIHTVGPIVNTGVPTLTHRLQLAACYVSCLEKAAQNDLHSIAFCCISTGVFGYPQTEAAEVAIATVREWLAKHSDNEMKVTFCTFKDYDTQLYRNRLS